jgi:integrase
MAKFSAKALNDRPVRIEQVRVHQRAQMDVQRSALLRHWLDGAERKKAFSGVAGPTGRSSFTKIHDGIEPRVAARNAKNSLGDIAIEVAGIKLGRTIPVRLRCPDLGAYHTIALNAGRRTDPTKILVRKHARERAGIPQCRVHDLRHTFGSRLRAAGVSHEDRKDLLGHKSREITTHYSRAEVSNLVAAVERLVERRESISVIRSVK